MILLSAKPEKAIEDLLKALGIPSAAYWARQIVLMWGLKAWDHIQAAPYELLSILPAEYFPRVDRLALHLGSPRANPSRVLYGVLAAISRAENEGHVFLPLEQALRQSMADLRLPQNQIGEVLIRAMAKSNVLALDEGRLYRGRYLTFEEGIAQDLVRRLTRRRQPLTYTPKGNLPLDPAQIRAIEMALCEPVSIITGPPGSGKTTITREITRALRRAGKRVMLAAPTGRAARVMGAATGMDAATVHRLIRIGMEHPLNFYGVDDLPADVVIVDEASMLDTGLLYHTLMALRPGARIIFIGDADQLPSVNPGICLRDMINSGVIPFVRLTEIHRQKKNSGIVKAAMAINEGRMPTGGGGFGLIEVRRATTARDQILAFIAAVRKHRGDEIDTRVMAAMYRGVAGIDQLNLLMQEKFNRDGFPLPFGGVPLRIGDPVTCTENDRRFEVYNGETGIVMGFNERRQAVHVHFEGRANTTTNYPLHRLKLAYASSVHKMQGSQTIAGALPVLGEHSRMLDRTLIYTAITRARDHFLMVADPEVLAGAIARVNAFNRNAGLSERLRRHADQAGVPVRPVA